MVDEPDWERFSRDELARVDASQRWHIISRLKSIEMGLGFIAFWVMLAAAKYLGVLDWIDALWG